MKWAAAAARIGLLAALLATGPAGAAELPPCRGIGAPEAGEAYPAYRERTGRAECRKPWLVLVYMAADNDLLPYALWDLYEMEAGYQSGRIAAGSAPRSDVLVQLSAPGLDGSRRLHMFQQQSEIYDGNLGLDDFKSRGPDDVRSPIAEQVPRLDGGQPIPAERDLEAFVEWGISRYPADHVMVVVWGHGQGWTSAEAGSFAGRHFGGLAFSDSQHTFLDIPSLHRALAQASAAVSGGRPLDVYASDACLMQMVEVASEISADARFVVGSSQVENYLGLPYRRLLFELNTGRFLGERARMGTAGTELEDDEPLLLARMLPRLFRASLDTLRGLHGRVFQDAIKTVTMSSLSSEALRGQLLPALGELGAALSAYLAEDPFRAVAVKSALRAAPSFLGGSEELGGFLKLLRQKTAAAADAQAATPDPSTPTARLLDAIDQAASALDSTVVAYALGTNYAGREDAMYLDGFRALAMWLPFTAADYRARIADFGASALYGAEPAWPEWLKQLAVD